MKHKNISTIIQALLALAVLLLPLSLLAQDAHDAEPVTSVTTVLWDPDKTPVENSESTLVRMEHGVYGIVRTAGLEPGDAITVWWIIFNYPENCSYAECSPDDVFLTDDRGNFVLSPRGARTANREGRAATGFSSLRAVGGIIDRDGT